MLGLIFAAPGIVAYEFYNHPNWLSADRVNKGKLLNPPTYLANINSKAKWRLILWYPKDCQRACWEEVDKLARIRLALGRRLYEVDELLVLKQASVSTELVQRFKDNDIHYLTLSAEQQSKQPYLTDKAQIFIANPENYLVLAYELTAKPEDVFHDIQQLLRTTKKSSM